MHHSMIALLDNLVAIGRTQLRPLWKNVTISLAFPFSKKKKKSFSKFDYYLEGCGNNPTFSRDVVAGGHSRCVGD